MLAQRAAVHHPELLERDKVGRPVGGPRLAALGVCAAAGFFIGIAGIDRGIDGFTRVANNQGFGSIVFENVLAGPHPLDVTSLRPKLRIPTELKGIEGWRFGLSVDLGCWEVEPEVEANTRAVAAALEEAGAIVDEVEIPWEFEQVVGTAAGTTFGYDKDGKPFLTKAPKLLLNDNDAGKPEGIHLMIGRRPRMSVGNSTGDRQMLEYTGAGDGASFLGPDWGQLGGTLANTPTPVNPCGDPTLEGGALRSQDVRTAGDPLSYDGTILRLDPATGAALPTNPLYGGAWAEDIPANMAPPLAAYFART